MHKAPPILILMAALAAGSASAEGTLSGTTISNIASAEYPDPNFPNDPSKALSSNSNTVTTVVLPNPGFDVKYTAGPADGGTQNSVTGTTVVTAGAVPGQAISTPYTLVNNGNVPLNITLSADTAGSAAGAAVKYYYYNALAANGLGTEIPAGSAVPVPADDPATLDDPLTTAVENDEGQVRIVQVITLPTNPAQINQNSVFGASPVGTVSGTQGADPLVTPGNGYAAGTTATEEGKATGTDLQFVRVTVYAPVLDNNPNGVATTPVDTQGQPLANPATTTPDITTVAVPLEATGTPNDPTPVVSRSGYVTPTRPATDPTPGGTPIDTTVADEQVAYPKADADATADTVVFTNTLKNTGGMADKVQLFPALADGTPDPAYTYNATTGVFSNAATGVSVRFLDPVTGAVVLASADPANPTAALYPTITAPNNSTVVYRTELTFPDTNDSSAIGTYTLLVGADSLSDADVTSNSTTTDTILPPAAQFGDPASGQGADATLTPSQTVNPAGTGADGTSAVDTDRTAVFPMDVVNNGRYADSYTLSGSVTFTDPVTGGSVTVPVLYYASDGVTLLPRLSTDPASPDYNSFITPVIAAGSEYQARAVIQTPDGQVQPGGSVFQTATGNYPVTQKATGNYSGVISPDSNDVIQVSPAGSVKVAKFAAKLGVAAGTESFGTIDNPTDYTLNANGAKPGQTISYRIIAKNTYNTPVPVLIRDTVPANTELYSVALNPVSAKTIYRVGGATGTWSATMPARGLPAGTVIDTALDVNGDLAPDNLAPGATLSVDFVVTVK